ncbi:hypothetical protein LG634_00800 [Streptomyces bambusae]|uniref:hypothetical protein n=1 Tax=Streptomyces bambusae TaxID=1550616 RepID=UPI001CFCFBA8|nr:hypothetical protein [Streptomyces bambusae]MCB5163392.1 hypothetical protein [Streptomyces bambusae]
MSSRFRAPGWAVGIACAGVVLLPPGAAQSGLTPAVTAAVTSTGDPAERELAGSAAGVGRARPGRAAEAAAERPAPVPAVREEPPAAVPEPVPPPTPSAVQAAPRPLAGDQSERLADIAAHLMPLGAGLALMGLGLGFLGMRLRR